MLDYLGVEMPPLTEPIVSRPDIDAVVEATHRAEQR